MPYCAQKAINGQVRDCAKGQERQTARISFVSMVNKAVLTADHQNKKTILIFIKEEDLNEKTN